MDTNDQPAASKPLRSTVIPIAQLTPDVDRLEGSSISSVVTLLWPYSSSTKSFSLLLAEPDFRLRRSNGQVKVLFHGHVAEAVAKTHIGIGDRVYLGLTGSRLVKNDAVAQTTGKGVSWDLHFDASAFLEVWRDSKLLSTVRVDRSSPPPPDNTVATPSTPAADGNARALGPLGSTSWQSPAFLEKSRVSFRFTDSVFDPFAEADGYIPGKGRKRPRFSMRSNDWRIIDEPESSDEKDLPDDWTAVFDEELATGSDVGEESVAPDAEVSVNPPKPEAVSDTVVAIDADIAVVETQPDASGFSNEQHTDRTDDETHFLRPTIALRSVPELVKPSVLSDGSHLPANTPRLQPVPSPGLPIPSPLNTTSNTPSGCFIALDAAVAAQSISPVSVVSEPDESTTPPQAQSDGGTAHIDEDDAVTVFAGDVQLLPESVSASGETTVKTQVPGIEEAANAIAMNGGPDAPAAETSHHTEVDIMETDASGVQPEEPGLKSQRSFKGEEVENEEAEDDKNEAVGRVSSFSLEQEEDSTSAERALERISPESDEKSDRMTAVGSENGQHIAEKIVVTQGDDRVHLIQSDSLSPEESRDVSEEPGQPYEEGEDDGMDRSDEEEDYDEEEDDYEDEEEPEIRHGYDYGDSESEVESEYSENPEESRSRFPPKTIEPEVIVLDSDSEDELAAQPSTVFAGRGTDKMIYSDESSYDSEDQGHPAEEIEDEGDQEDELEDYREDEYDQVGEYEEEEELENEYQVDEGRVDDQSLVDERLADESPSEADELHQELHDEELTEGQYKTIHDSLNYLATVSESAERTHVSSKYAEHVYDMAIDPKLYEFGTPQAVSQDVEEERSADATTGYIAETPESKRESDLALQLDGAAPAGIPGPSEKEARYMVNHHETRQLVTPGPFQSVEVDQTPGLLERAGEVLHPPDLTQDMSASELITQPLPMTPIPAGTFGITDDDNPLVAAIVSENSLTTLKREEDGEPQTPIVVVDTNVPLPSDEDQALQASIEVNEDTEGATDGTHLTPINRHYPGLRSKLSYFAPLATLIDHYNALVDTISIVSEVRPASRAASGKKDFILTLQLTDPSMAGTTVYAQILRPYKPALPTFQEGDAILLRNFRVKSFNRSVVLASDNTSAWAVFSAFSEEPQINGPPVEYGNEEKTFATDLRQWYLEDGIAMVADNQLQASVGRESRDVTPTSSAAASDAGSIDVALREAHGNTSVSSRGSKRRKSQRRRITIHELRDGRRYTEVGSSPGEDSIHELRDGTVYANL